MTATEQRQWFCQGCGDAWPDGTPDHADRCACGDDRWVSRWRRDARDDRPVRERRSKAGNAARLAEMADLSAPDERLAVCEAELDAVRAIAEELANEIARLVGLLDDRWVEAERLRVIVDLACAEQLAQEACLRDPAGAMALAVAWNDATDARIAAVAAEVARRAQL